MAEPLSDAERDKLRQVAASIRHSGSSDVSKIIARAVDQLLDDLKAVEARLAALRSGVERTGCGCLHYTVDRDITCPRCDLLAADDSREAS